MPLFTRTFQIIAGVLTVSVLGVSTIGTSYTSPFLEHLVDIVEGTTTNTDISANAPNWGYGVPLPQVQPIGAATSSIGTLASSTKYSFEVFALDQLGTTTPSTIFYGTTDASSTLNPAESLLLSWTPVAGAQGYQIAFATGTVSTASSFNQCFYATTTSSYEFATSTGSTACSYSKSDTTAFADLLQPNGVSYIEGDNGTATNTVATSTQFEVNGAARFTETSTTTSCDAQTAGAVFYNTANSHEWGCNGTNWTKIF